MVAPTAVVACDCCDARASTTPATLATPATPAGLQQLPGQEWPSSGQNAWQEESQLHAVQERLLCTKLRELAQDLCPYCWGLLYEVFDGVRGSKRSREEEMAEDSIWECPRLAGVDGVAQLDRVWKWVWYKKEIQVCWKCGVLEHLCRQEKEREASKSCVWSYTVVAILYGLREAAWAKKKLEGEEVYRETVLGQAGYREEEEEDSRENRDRGFGQWIGERYSRGRIVRHIGSKGIATILATILREDEVEI